ncbi:RNA polymerase II mediator complex subunit [Oleoguttula sp. CCFEE 5521]
MDRLTQLQDTLDDLMTQMYATLSYINTKHPYGDFPSQPSQAPQSHSTAHPSLDYPVLNGSPTPKINGTTAPARDADGDNDKKDASSQHLPDPPEVFQETMRRLAQSLVLQEQKAEILINSLPGLGNSEAMQRERIKELEGELREVEQERRAADGERERLVEMLGEVVVGSRRVR